MVFISKNSLLFTSEPLSNFIQIIFDIQAKIIPKPGPKYVFRGTTVNFAGGRIAQMGYTYTSAHPAKATLFAVECRTQFSQTPVIYIAEYEPIAKLRKTANRLKAPEEEIVFGVKPTDFYKCCLGYVTLEEMQSALRQMDQGVTASADYGSLTNQCKTTDKMSREQIENLVNILRPLLKN